jgi:hypothetical protein
MNHFRSLYTHLRRPRRLTTSLSSFPLPRTENTKTEKTDGIILLFNHLNCFVVGLGVSYAVTAEKYHELPLVFLFPYGYCGYQTFKIFLKP